MTIHSMRGYEIVYGENEVTINVNKNHPFYTMSKKELETEELSSIIGTENSLIWRKDTDTERSIGFVIRGSNDTKKSYRKKHAKKLVNYIVEYA